MADPTHDEQIVAVRGRINNWERFLQDPDPQLDIEDGQRKLETWRAALATLERHAQVEQELRADCVAACDLASKAAEECGDLRQERDRAQARWHAAVEMGMDVERERDAARAELADLQRTFDLQWKADQRAIKMWQEAHPGNDMVWPDRCNMVVWLLDELTDLIHDVERYQANLGTCEQEVDRLAAELAEAKAEIERPGEATEWNAAAAADMHDCAVAAQDFIIAKGLWDEFSDQQPSPDERWAKVAALRERHEDLVADAANDAAYIDSLRQAIDQLVAAYGTTRGTDDWEVWIKKQRQRHERAMAALKACGNAYNYSDEDDCVAACAEAAGVYAAFDVRETEGGDG